MRAEDARSEPMGDGGYRVTLAIEAKKVRADSIGNETEVPMGEPLYLERHRIRVQVHAVTAVRPGA